MQLWLIPIFPFIGFLLNGILGRLNNGERLQPQDVERALGEHMA